jgi:preprotein translocase subunit SecF
MKFDKIKEIYEDKYKKLLIIPFLILVLAFVQIGMQYSATGDFLNKGISLKGGSAITITDSLSMSNAQLESALSSQFPKAHFTVRTLSSAGGKIGITIESDAQTQSEINNIIKIIEEETGLDSKNFGIEIIGSSLGESFFKQTFTALIIAFILMGIVVFFYFRSIAPSLAVILAAFSDIVVTLAVFNLTGIKLSTAGIAAFLMLIGYSVDTDILLSTRVLKRRNGTIMERIYGAMKTGLTMSATTLSAIGVALLFVQGEIVRQIMIVLFIGLLVDLVMTWIHNVGILRFYLEKKKK